MNGRKNALYRIENICFDVDIIVNWRKCYFINRKFFKSVGILERERINI